MKACNQCGKCCIKYGGGGLSATADEIAAWETFKPDIYRYTNNGNIWTEPDTGAVLSRCPWLREQREQRELRDMPAANGSEVVFYSCAIYEDRPEDCRHYPTLLSEMIRDECEMIEVKDLAKPKRAQEQLDVMMADSRPPAL